MRTNIPHHYISLFSLLIVVLFFSSCDKQDDNYSIGDFIVSFGIVEKSPESTDGTYLIRLDNGDSFVTVTPSLNIHDIDAGQRVFVNFAPFEDKVNTDNTKTIYGKINLIQSILYKDVLQLSEVNSDSIGKDPIIVRESWITGDSILTVGFSYYTSGSVHKINLADNAEGNGIEKPLILEFRHNANGDKLMYRAAGYASFRLNNFRIAGQHKVDFYLRYTDYEGKRIDIPHTINY